MVIADANYLAALEDLQTASFVSGPEFQDARDAVDVTAAIWVLAFLASASVFLAWFYRAYRNLQRLSMAGVRYKSGWAIGAWFVPILNLFRPKQIANDIWRAGDPGADISSNAWHSRPVSPLLHWWWALWLVGGALAGVAAGMSNETYGEPLSTVAAINDEETAVTWDIVSSLLFAGAAVLAALVVYRIGMRQDAIIATAGPRSMPPPASPPMPPPASPPQHGGAPPPPPTMPVGPSEATSSTSLVAGELSCPVCGWRFQRWDQVGEHVGIHHPSEAAWLLSRPPRDK